MVHWRRISNPEKIVYERYLFNTCNQQPNEQVDQYVNKLRQLAASCEFQGLRDELIRDRLVLGCRDSIADALSMDCY